ncbi:MAG TPA: hypothetical protein VFE77_03050 [Rhodanobacter sp.]|nr:hypothetical protein [Rhodanobacter sp.]
MTIETPAFKTTVTGNGAATVFSFSPVVLYADGQLTVFMLDLDGNQTQLVEGTGTGNFGVNMLTGYPGTGSITYPNDGVSPPLATGWKLAILPDFPLVQTLALDNQGGYLPENQEQALDYLTMLVQQLQAELDLCLQVPVTGATPGATLAADLEAVAANLPAIGIAAAQNIGPAVAIATGTSQTRSIADWLASDMWPEDFGTTGTNDDTTVVQDALTTIASMVASINTANTWQIDTSGPLLRFKSGRRYTINPATGLTKAAGFSIDARGALIGTPEASPIVITLSPQVNPSGVGSPWSDEIKGGNWTCVNFLIQGSGTNSVISWTQGITLRDLGMFGWNQAGSFVVPEGITVGKCANAIQLARCFISSYNTGIRIIGHDGSGKATRGHSRTIIDGCHIGRLAPLTGSGTAPGDGNTGTGIWLDLAGADGETLLISDLLVEGANYGIYLDNGSGTKATANSGLYGAGAGGGNATALITGLRCDSVQQMVYNGIEGCTIVAPYAPPNETTPMINDAAIYVNYGVVNVLGARIEFPNADSTDNAMVVNRANGAVGFWEGNATGAGQQYPFNVPAPLRTLVGDQVWQTLVTGVLYVYAQGSGSFKFQFIDDAGFFSNTLSTAISSGSISVGSGDNEVTFTIGSSSVIYVAFGSTNFTLAGNPAVTGWNAQPTGMVGGGIAAGHKAASTTVMSITFYDLDLSTGMAFTGLASGQNMAIALSLRLSSA